MAAGGDPLAADFFVVRFPRSSGNQGTDAGWAGPIRDKRMNRKGTAGEANSNSVCSALGHLWSGAGQVARQCGKRTLEDFFEE
jgi:hypothetical protein